MESYPPNGKANAAFFLAAAVAGIGTFAAVIGTASAIRALQKRYRRKQVTKW